MAVLSKLLMVPLEIRHQIYSYMLLNEHVLDIIAANVTCPQESGLFLACRQLHFEAFEYYYDANSFQLSLHDPTFSHENGNFTLIKHLGKIRNLQVEAVPGKNYRGGESSDDEEELRFDAQAVRWRRFTRQLIKARKSQTGMLLKSLVLVDRFSHGLLRSYCSNEKHVQPPELLLRFDDQMATLNKLMMPLEGKIGSLTVEIRSGYVWDPYMSIEDLPYEVLMSFPILSRKSSQPWMEPENCTVKLESRLAHHKPCPYCWCLAFFGFGPEDVAIGGVY